MPLLCSTKCEGCGFAGGVFPTEYAALVLEDGMEVILPHPSEDVVLSKHGFRLDTAPLKFYRAYACFGCGAIIHLSRDEDSPSCKVCGKRLLEIRRNPLTIKCAQCGQLTFRVSQWGIS